MLMINQDIMIIVTPINDDNSENKCSNSNYLQEQSMGKIKLCACNLLREQYTGWRRAGDSLIMARRSMQEEWNEGSAEGKCEGRGTQRQVAVLNKLCVFGFLKVGEYGPVCVFCVYLRVLTSGAVLFIALIFLAKTQVIKQIETVKVNKS